MANFHLHLLSFWFHVNCLRWIHQHHQHQRQWRQHHRHRQRQSHQHQQHHFFVLFKHFVAASVTDDVKKE